MALRYFFSHKFGLQFPVTIPAPLPPKDNSSVVVCHINPTIEIKILKLYSVSEHARSAERIVTDNEEYDILFSYNK
jgi:hypothetical protein